MPDRLTLDFFPDAAAGNPAHLHPIEAWKKFQETWSESKQDFVVLVCGSDKFGADAKWQLVTANTDEEASGLLFDRMFTF